MPGGDKPRIWCQHCDALIFLNEEGDKAPPPKKAKPDEFLGIPKENLVIHMAAALNGRHEYFNRRGITNSVIDKHLLGWSDKLRRYSIPNFVDGALWAIQYRASTLEQEKWGKYISEQGGKNKNLFNTQVISSSLPYLIVTESPLDCLAMESCGFPCISKFDGNQARETWQSEYNKRIKGIPEIVIVPDNDAPGEAIALSLKENIPRSRIALLPEGIKDLTEFIVARGADARSELWKVLGVPPILKEQT